MGAARDVSGAALVRLELEWLERDALTRSIQAPL